MAIYNITPGITAKKISELPIYRGDFGTGYIPVNIGTSPQTYGIYLSALTNYIVARAAVSGLSGISSIPDDLILNHSLTVGPDASKYQVQVFTGSSNNDVTVNLNLISGDTAFYLTPRSAYGYKISVIGINVSSYDIVNYEFIGSIKCDQSGHVSQVGYPTKIIHYSPSEDIDINLAANNTNQSLTVSVKSHEEIKWTSSATFTVVNL